MDSGITIEMVKEELLAVRTARMEIYKGMQSVSRSGISYTRAQLNTLSEREQQLLSQLEKMTDGIVIVSDVGGADSGAGSEGDFNNAGE